MPDAERPNRAYYPRVIGVAPPPGKNTHEFVILGRDEIGVFAKVCAIFAGHKVNLTSIGTCASGGPEDLVFTMHADFAKSDCSPDQVAKEIGALPFIKDIDQVSSSGLVYDRFLFPIYMADNIRAMLITVQDMIQIEKYFEERFGSGGSMIMFQEGRQAGLARARMLRRATPDVTQPAYLRLAEDELRATGWGIFTIDVSGVEDGAISVTVKEPAILEAEGGWESWYTYGLCSGIAEGIYGSKTIVDKERTYSSQTKELRFRLVEQGGPQVNLSELR